jgi:hypothetical protein
MPKRLFAAILATMLLLAVPHTAYASPAPAATNGEILFVRQPVSGGPMSLYATAPDGSHRREVRRSTGDFSRGAPFAASPEGRRLLGSRTVEVDGRAVTRLTVSNVDGSSVRDIAEPGTSFRGGAWSPDGLEVAYLGGGRLFVVPADGSEQPRELAGPLPPGPLLEVEWSPTGERLALRSGEGNQSTVWTTDLDGRDHRRVTTWRGELGRVDDGQELAWAPDGRRMAYVGRSSEREVDGGCAFAELGLIDLATSTRARIEPSPATAYEELCNAGFLRWSPDGRHLVFSASRPIGWDQSTHWSLYRFDLDDGTLTQITDRAEVNDYVVDWLPVPDLLARACPPGEVPAAGFPDTAGTAHARGIDCAAWWEVASGRSDGTYGPGAPVTRAQMASFVARALEAAGVEMPEVSGSRFGDVDATSTHGRRIEQLAELGIVDGVRPGRYEPGRSVTRAQMAKFLVGAYELAADARLPRWPDAFTDDDGIALESSVNAVSSIGLASGVDANRYAPGDAVSRGQMATFLSRLVDRLARDLDLPAR